jgi:ubiquinone biosynthesis protein
MPILRLLRIAFAACRWGLGWSVERLSPWRPRVQSPERLCLALTRLGTTFIKFGQALSIRRDMLPDRYAAALHSLQEHVVPFPAEIAIREIEGGLGHPVTELFADFDRGPLAAGSVAQVHAARLQDEREAIVKVRRPGIKAQIHEDMRALRLLARAAAAIVPRLKHYQPLRLIEEIRTNLEKEIDFRQEARNIRRFAAAFADWTTVHIPGVFDDLACETVVVQQRSAGRRIDDPAVRADGPRLAQNFVEAYLHQIFVLGVFHGDPHPGNLFITADGRICLHDFGLIGSLDRNTRRNLAAFTAAFVHQDPEWFLDAAIDLGVLGGDIDRAEFRRGLAAVISDYAALPLNEWSLAEAFLRVTQLGRAQNVFIPYDLVLLMRALFLAENVVRTLDPEFQLLETLKTKGPEALKAAMGAAEVTGSLDRLKHEGLSAVQDLPEVLFSWARRLGRQGAGSGINLELRALDRVGEHIDRSSNRLSLALVTLGLYVAGSLLMQHSIGPRLWGGMPALAAFAYALALWFTLRLARGIARSGKL